MSVQSDLDWRSWPLEAKAELRWRLSARPNQVPPTGDWNVWLLLAGRGFGKTRTGAEWVRRLVTGTPHLRVAVVAPTFGDARDTCVEGESGLYNEKDPGRSVIPVDLIEKWNRSLGELTLKNGSQVKLFSADSPERLRGPQHHFAWCDELAAWELPEAWDQLMFGLRLGTHPRVVVTTTPRPTKQIKELVERKDVVTTRGVTRDNEANLAPAALAQLYARYEGTRLGRQELEAEILEDVEGALWNNDMVAAAYLAEAPCPMKRIVVGVDPAGGGAAETGIVVAGLGTDGRGYVLADRSMVGSPAEWGRRVLAAYEEFQADKILVESNFGGDMAISNIKSLDPVAPVKKLSASRGKIPRAEPVASLYEQGRVSHVGRFPKLEEQMCTYTADDRVSPDRMDAMVWCFVELMLAGRFVNKFVAPGGVTKTSPWRVEVDHGNEAGILD